LTRARAAAYHLSMMPRATLDRAFLFCVAAPVLIAASLAGCVTSKPRRDLLARTASRHLAHGLALLALALAGCTTGAAGLEHHASGAEATLDDLRGRVVLLNFWATWCAPCIVEIPVLRKVAEDYGPDVLFVAVYHGPEWHERERVERWLEKQPAFFAQHVAWGNPELMSAFPHNPIPMTYVLGRDGKLVAEFRGAIKGEREKVLRDAIERGLAAQAPAAR
jgi:thiol-disulfide isomerase/thioredoxin